MIARSHAVVAADGRLARLTCQPPLTLRRVGPPDPPGRPDPLRRPDPPKPAGPAKPTSVADSAGCALCLVGSAAGPLPGDDLTLRLELLDGASATLQATGAAIAQGRPGGPAGVLRIQAVLGRNATLRADPGPLIVRPGGRVDASVAIDLGPGARVDWRELIVLGGSSGRIQDSGPSPHVPPAATLRWDVTRAGAPLLRQVIDLTDPEGLAWPGMLAGRRVLASALLAGRGISARTIVAAPAAVAQRLAEDAVLITVLADDAAAAQREVDDLCARVRSGCA
jgi:urease accessory protein